ncbi:hypothetical protein KAJ27_16975 [bacterium]|nr:hypothetical protein [bacterium]
MKKTVVFVLSLFSILLFLSVPENLYPKGARKRARRFSQYYYFQAHAWMIKHGSKSGGNAYILRNRRESTLTVVSGSVPGHLHTYGIQAAYFKVYGSGYKHVYVDWIKKGGKIRKELDIDRAFAHLNKGWAVLKKVRKSMSAYGNWACSQKTETLYAETIKLMKMIRHMNLERQDRKILITAATYLDTAVYYYNRHNEPNRSSFPQRVTRMHKIKVIQVIKNLANRLIQITEDPYEFENSRKVHLKPKNYDSGPKNPFWADILFP